VITEHQVDTVVVSFALTREAELLDAVITAHRHGCLVLIVPRMFEVYQDGPDVERIGGYPLLRLRPDPTSQPMWAVKRAIDRLFSATALVLLSPVLAVCAAAILLESGRPVLFHQTRVGLDGIPFRIHKLRTLKPENEEESQTRWNVAGDCRLGRVGKILRRTSMDEVPQLWNILRGEMSFVGPRPERPGFVEIFSHEHARYWARHRVPVGLTGLAQVNGLRGDTSIADRARFDNYYIANWSVWLDIKILALTVREVLRGSGS
jgi:exopolysaccharide biosynthesis polyprenyl glycosylphosphotransferase